MADRKLTLKVLTPGRTVLDEQADMVVLRTANGDKGILAGHERCALMLGSGMMRIRTGETWGVPYIIDGGYATVERDTVTVMSVLAERVDKVDALMEEMEQQRLRKRSESEKWEQEIKRTETAIRRLLVEQSTNAYAVLKGRGEGQDDDDDEGGDEGSGDGQ